MPARLLWHSTTKSGPRWSGTIAGDDTILVICPDAKVADKVRTQLLGLLN